MNYDDNSSSLSSEVDTVTGHSQTHSCWDGMGWAALVTQCISVEAFT